TRQRRKDDVTSSWRRGAQAASRAPLTRLGGPRGLQDGSKRWWHPGPPPGSLSPKALGEHAAGGATFDLVALLNVLDRASRPRTLLRQLVGLLTPVAGRLVLAVVLPFRPGVEDGTAWLDPEEELPIFGASWEDALSQLVVEVLEPMGFRVEAASRVPYVSQGDWHTNYYVLSDALLVLSAPSRGGAAGETASGDTAAA
ncbi:unnamed protein product, partial [Prorocentrum cordatum]